VNVVLDGVHTPGSIVSVWVSSSVPLGAAMDAGATGGATIVGVGAE
jgi:hypothetical protein